MVEEHQEDNSSVDGEWLDEFEADWVWDDNVIRG